MEADLAGKSVVRVRKDGATVTVQGPFDHAGEPRAAANGVVFTAFLTAKPDGDSDVYYVVPGETQASPVATGPGQQRFADITTDFIAISDFSEDPDLTFNENATDLADVSVYDRQAKTWHGHSRAGKQAFPMLGAQGKVAYLSWSPDHPEPKFSQYELFVGDIASPGQADILAAEITTSSPYVRPTAQGGKLEWVEWPLGDKASLWRRPADLSADAAAVPGFSFSTLYGPATSAHLTVAASQGRKWLHDPARRSALTARRRRDRDTVLARLELAVPFALLDSALFSPGVQVT